MFMTEHAVHSQVVEAEGHLIDSQILNVVFDTVVRRNASFDVSGAVFSAFMAENLVYLRLCSVENGGPFERLLAGAPDLHHQARRTSLDQ